jgi:hypothetical protein
MISQIFGYGLQIVCCRFQVVPAERMLGDNRRLTGAGP